MNASRTQFQTLFFRFQLHPDVFALVHYAREQLGVQVTRSELACFIGNATRYPEVFLS